MAAMLSKDTKIYVAGHRGLVGSAIWNNLKQYFSYFVCFSWTNFLITKHF